MDFTPYMYTDVNFTTFSLHNVTGNHGNLQEAVAMDTLRVVRDAATDWKNSTCFKNECQTTLTSYELLQHIHNVRNL